MTTTTCNVQETCKIMAFTRQQASNIKTLNQGLCSIFYAYLTTFNTQKIGVTFSQSTRYSAMWQKLNAAKKGKQNEST